jgi:hypothetical protein
MEKENFSLRESWIDDITRFYNEDNDFLTTPFTKKEVRNLVPQMKHNKPQVRMVFMLSLSKKIGMSLSQAFWNCLAFSTLDN